MSPQTAGRLTPARRYGDLFGYRSDIQMSRADPLNPSPAATNTPVPPVPADQAGRDLLARFCRALGDPTRLALLAFCAEAERTGNECVAHVGLSQGRVSAHLGCLVTCGLLETRRAGRFAYYQVSDPRVADLVGLAVSMVADHADSIAACARVAPPPGATTG